MGTPVKLSDDIVAAARSVAALAHRSLTKQIEHWAELGRAVEQLVPTPEQFALKAHLGRPSDGAAVAESRAALTRLVAALADSKQREAAVALIGSAGGPIYGATPDGRGIVQVLPDGRRIVGHMADGEFVADPGSKRPSPWRSKKR